MEFNVSQLLKEAVGTARRYRVAEQVRLPDNEGSYWVEGDVHLLKTDKGVLAQCSLGTEAEDSCSRCLAPLRRSVALSIEEEYFPIVDPASGLRVVPPEDETFTLDERHILSLDEAFRQYLVMSAPIQPLCHDNCLGLCPTCGGNRNSQPCLCATATENPRWSALRQLAR